MYIKYSNFNFIKEYNFGLYMFAQEAEKNIYINNDTCLYKIRKILETIIRDIYKKAGIENKYTRSLHTNIEYLYNNTYINKTYFEVIEQVRIICNYSIHNNINEINISDEELIDVLENTFIVCCYYIIDWYNCNTNIDGFSRKYYHNCRKTLIEEVHEQKSNEENFFAYMFDLLTQEVKIAVSTNKQIEFLEFYKSYLNILNFIIIKDESKVDDIIRFKRICSQRCHSEDGNTINMYICRVIYEHIYHV